MRRNRGETLIESLISMFFVTVIIVPFANLFLQTFKTDVKVDNLNEKNVNIENMAEILKAKKYNEIVNFIGKYEISKVEDFYNRFAIEKKYQFFIVTNSPFILNSVKNNNIFCLERQENKVICKTGDELYSTYGQSVDRILKDIMGLKTTRNIAIENKINELRKMIDKNEYNSEEFKIKFNNLKEILGNSDEDIFLMEIDIKSKEKK